MAAAVESQKNKLGNKKFWWKEVSKQQLLKDMKSSKDMKFSLDVVAMYSLRLASIV
jgi:hypothetical protein